MSLKVVRNYLLQHREKDMRATIHIDGEENKMNINGGRENNNNNRG